MLTVATMWAAGPALAQEGDRDCPDFPSQAAAQRVFNQDPSDPERLDADGDRIACETNGPPSLAPRAPRPPAATTPRPDPGAGTGSRDGRGRGDNGDEQPAPMPVGGVDAGYGGMVEEPFPVAAASVALTGALLTVGGVVVARRRSGERGSR